jgi:hypothetical protein
VVGALPAQSIPATMATGVYPNLSVVSVLGMSLTTVVPQWAECRGYGRGGRQSAPRLQQEQNPHISVVLGTRLAVGAMPDTISLVSDAPGHVSSMDVPASEIKLVWLRSVPQVFRGNVDAQLQRHRSEHGWSR